MATQLLTSRGIAVVDVDYGGSTGYGRAYRCELNGAWGVVDVDDCVAAAQFLADRGDVDPRRMAIEGGSAGGYTTLAALAFRDAFAAGISRSGSAT
jgi:dipeptidyl aminopeptidase/acylaminoacyl peptidase